MHLILFSLLIICYPLSSVEISHSIVPIVANLENQTTLIPKKYSTAHYKEILSALEQQDQKIRISSFNMFFDIYDPKMEPKNRWPQRLPRIVQALKVIQADIMGVQELQSHQLEQLMKEIGSEYAFHFIPEFDYTQTTTKDFDGILYRKSRFEVLDGKCFHVTRPCKNTLITMGKFRDKKTKKELYVFNAHFPSQNPSEGERTAIQTAQIIKPYTETGAVILTGDLNTIATLPDMPGLPWYGGERIESILTESNIIDSYRKSLLGHVGPLATFTNEPQGPVAFIGHGTPSVFLDHIFVSKEFTVLIHAVDPIKVDGHFPSDHMPLFIDVINSP